MPDMPMQPSDNGNTVGPVAPSRRTVAGRYGACCAWVLLLSALLIGSLSCPSIASDDPELAGVYRAVDTNAVRAGHLEPRVRLTVNRDPDSARIRKGCDLEVRGGAAPVG